MMHHLRKKQMRRRRILIAVCGVILSSGYIGYDIATYAALGNIFHAAGILFWAVTGALWFSQILKEV